MSKRVSDTSESRERVLDAAEQLFMERGFDRVSMRDLAQALGVRQAALYYHAPDGKVQLFMMVIERNMMRQREGLEQVIAAAPTDIRSQLTAIGYWLAANMPVDMIGMLRSDAAAAGTNAQQMLGHVREALMMPIVGVVVAAQQRGEIRSVDPMALAGMLLAAMNWTTFLTRHVPSPRTDDEMVGLAVSIILDGVRL